MGLAAHLLEAVRADVLAAAQPGLGRRVQRRQRAGRRVLREHAARDVADAREMVKLYEKLELDEPTITGEPRELVVAGVQLAPLQVTSVRPAGSSRR